MRTTALFVGFALFAATSVAAQTRLGRWQVEMPGPVTETAGEILRVSGGRGWIRTPGVFQDFVLRLQFRPTPNADGAVLLRTYLLKAAGWPASGLRVALNGGKGSAGDVRAFHGNVRDVAMCQERVITPAEWHDLEIRAEGRIITVAIAEAVAAVKKFLFYPGTKDGRPVTVLVSVETSFSLGR